MMETLWQDLRYAVRILLKSPGFTTVAVLSIALGIGANTAIFSLVDKVLLRTLPAEQPERLVLFVDNRGVSDSFSHPFYTDLRDRNDVLSGLVAYNLRTSFSLSDDGQSEHISGQSVSGNYFSVLGVNAALGRMFLPEEHSTPGTHPVAVVSYGLWQRRFGADPGLVGKTMALNGHRFTVVGIAPREFAGTIRGYSPEIYIPMMMHDGVRPAGTARLASRYDSWLYMIGRLKPGVNREPAQAALTTLAGQLKQAYPETVNPERIFLADGSQGNTDFVHDLSLPLILLVIVVGLVLLIACTNVANLLLARAGVRRKEVAVRLAVGAGRGRIIRQLLTESVLLSFLGGGLGLLIAVWLIDLSLIFRPPDTVIPLTMECRLNTRVLGLTLLLSLLAGILFGLAPAFQASKPDVVSALKEETPTLGRGTGRLSLRSLLIVAQVALALVVLVSAGLCLRSLQRLRAIDPGFEPAKVLVMSLDPSLNGYNKVKGQQFFHQLVERVSALPGVEAASLANVVPLGGDAYVRTVDTEGYERQPNEQIALCYNVVAPNYFQTMGTPLIRGRDFGPQDTAGAPRVVIINQALAHRYWRGQDPAGRRLRLTNWEQSSQIIGIVQDSKYQTLTENARPILYLPLVQHYEPSMSLHVRTAADPKSILSAVRREVQSLDPNLPAYNIKTLAEQKSSALYRERMAATLLGGFGVLTLLLAVVGIYGVTAYAVNWRTKEIGIRMALGAEQQDILKLVLGEGMALVATGIALGLGGALAATRLLSSFLYGVHATDPLTYLTVGLLLVAVALLANYIPARRATRVDPMVALRYE